MHFSLKNGVKVFMIESPNGDGSVIISGSYNGENLPYGGKIKPDHIVETLKKLEEYNPLEERLDFSWHNKA